MTKLFKLKLLLITVCMAIVLMFSCKDEENKIGEGIFPNDQKVGVFVDSVLPLNAYTYQSENYINTTRTMNNILFGYMNDPVVGSVACDIITHVSALATSTSAFLKKDAKVIVDSCVLYLEFQVSDGDINGIQHFTLYELNKDVSVSNLDNKELYNHTLSRYFDKSKPLKKFTYQPRQVWRDNKNKQSYTPIAFALPKEFAERLLITDTIIGTDTIKPYDKPSDFNKYVLNGFYLEANPDPQSKAVSIISKLSNRNIDSTRLELFYRVKKTDTTESHSQVYNIALQTKASIFKTSLNKNLVYNKMYTNLNMAKTGENVYLKNNNGLYTRILIDNIGDWTDSGTVAINKASVILPVEQRVGADTLLKPIRSVYAFYRQGSRSYSLQMHVNDKGQPAPIGYNYKLKGYEVILTNEVQKLYHQKKWNEPIELIIKSATNDYSARSSIIASPTNKTNPMRLRLTYTKY